MKKPHHAGRGRVSGIVAWSAHNPETIKRPGPLQTARIIRLPIFRDGVWIGNEFLRIGPGLRARIREMAREGGR